MGSLGTARGPADRPPPSTGTRPDSPSEDGHAAGSTALSPGPAAAREKALSIETLRGVAIVCVVIGHVIGDGSGSGLRVDPGSIYRHWYDATRYLRMPMFLAISGFLYAERPVMPGKYAQFIRGKARLLILPFLSAATLQYLMKGLLPGVNSSTHLRDIWRIYVYGFDQFWFSQAAILTFATLVILEWLVPLSGVRKWLVYLLLAIVLDVVGPKPGLFSFVNFERMLPLFCLGGLLARPPAWLVGRTVLTAAFVVFAFTLSIQQLQWFGRLDLPQESYEWLRLSEAMSFIYLLFYYRWTTPWLALIGGSAYPIYLFHVFGTAGSRILMGRIGVHERLVLLAVGVACGLAVPLALERLFMRTAVTRRVFLGKR